MKDVLFDGFVELREQRAHGLFRLIPLFGGQKFPNLSRGALQFRAHGEVSQRAPFVDAYLFDG